MADRDPIDRNFLIFCVVTCLFIFGLAVAIFPHPEAPATSTPAAAKK